MSVFVAEHLDFDVAGIHDELLDEYPIIAERRLASALHRRKPSATSFRESTRPDALTATAGRSFDHYRIADLLRDSAHVPALDLAERPGTVRNLGGLPRTS